MKIIKKHFKVLAAFVRISLKTSIEYMNDFAALALDFCLTIVFSLLFWNYLLGDFDRLAGWDMKELVVLALFGSSSWSIGQFLAGSWQLSEKITGGQLDKYICRPVNPLFSLVLEDMQLDEVLKGVMSLSIFLVLYKVKLGAVPSLGSVICSVLLLFMGIIIVALVRCIFSCVSFWIENERGISMFVHMEDFDLHMYPVDMFDSACKIILFSIIPVAFISYVPASVYLRKNTLSPLYFLGGEAVIIVLLLLVLKLVWGRGIRKYEANGG